MKTAAKALFLFWLVAILSITLGLVLSSYYEEQARICALQGGNRVHATCQGVTP